MTEERKPFWVKCEPCGHCWAPAYFPMEAGKFAKAAKNVLCPMCGNGPKNIVVAKQHNGVLKEVSA